MDNIVTGQQQVIPTQENLEQRETPPLEPPPRAPQMAQEGAPSLEGASMVPLSQTLLAEPSSTAGDNIERYLLPSPVMPTMPDINNDPRVQQVFRDTSSSRLRQQQAFRSDLESEVVEQSRGTRETNLYNNFPNAPKPLLTLDVGQQLREQDQRFADQRARSSGWDELDWEFSSWGNRPQATQRPISQYYGQTNYGALSEPVTSSAQPNSPYRNFLQTGNLTDYETGEQYAPPIPANDVLARLQRRNAPGYESASFPGASLPDRSPDAQVNSSRSVVGNNGAVQGETPNLLRQFLFGNPTTSLEENYQQNRNLLGLIKGLAQDIVSWDRGSVTQRQAWQRVIKGDMTALDELLPNAAAPLRAGLETSAPVPTNNALQPYAFNPAKGQFGEAGSGWTGAALYALGLPENLLWAGVYGVADLAVALGGDAGANLPILRNIPSEGEPRGIIYRLGQAASGTDLSLLNVQDGDRYLSLIDPTKGLGENLARGALGFGASVVVGGWADNTVRAARRGLGAGADAARGILGQVPEYTRYDAIARRNTAAMGADPFENIAELGRNPTAELPVPQVVRRSNAEIGQLAAQNGDIPAPWELSNEDVRALQLLPNGEQYSRFGAPVEMTTEAAPLPLRQVDMETVRETESWLHRDINPTEPDLIRASIKEYDRSLYQPDAVVEWSLLDAPESMAPLRITDETVNITETYLRNTDELTSTGRGLQELEQTIERSRWEILRQSRQLNTSMLGRGKIADEIATRLNLSDKVLPGSVVHQLYEPLPVEGTPRRWLFHGTRQQNIQGIDLRNGTAHEYGVGLYMTTDMSEARLAAKAARVVSNPIPGTTRLGVPTVFEVQPVLKKTLNLNTVRSEAPDVVRIFSEEAANVLGLERIEHKGTQLRDLWLDVRSSYVSKRSAPIPELRFKDFSNRVSQRLTEELGYDSLEDVSRGVVVALPKGEFGQVMAQPRVAEVLRKGRTSESFYARQQLDARMAKALEHHPVADAWERQSRVLYENQLMQDLVKTYRQESEVLAKQMNDTIKSQHDLMEHTRVVKEQTLADLRNPRHVPDEVRPFTEVDIDEPCM